MKVLLMAVAVLCLGLGACPQPMPPVPPGPEPADVPDAALPTDVLVATPDTQPATFDALCNKLASFGCPEGTDVHCAEVLQRNFDRATSVANLNLDCLMAAATLPALLECGSVECAAPKIEAALLTSSKCKKACSNLSKLKCKESDGCLDVCNKNGTSTVSNINLDCLTTAKTKSAARKCGSVACP